MKIPSLPLSLVIIGLLLVILPIIPEYFGFANIILPVLQMIGALIIIIGAGAWVMSHIDQTKKRGPELFGVGIDVWAVFFGIIFVFVGSGISTAGDLFVLLGRFVGSILICYVILYVGIWFITKIQNSSR